MLNGTELMNFNPTWVAPAGGWPIFNLRTRKQALPAGTETDGRYSFTNVTRSVFPAMMLSPETVMVFPDGATEGVNDCS